MKLTVPTNWDNNLVKKIKKPGVEVVYGKLDRDFVGGGRPSCVLRGVSRRNAKLHISNLFNEGLKFYYILNSSCMGNREWTISGNKKINELLDWLSGMQVYGIVVTSSYLLQYISKKYPHFKFSISSFANINSVEKAKFWEDLGATVITLPQVEVNRDFKLLERIRKNVKCELQVIVNDNCLQNCPLFSQHNNAVSHASETSDRLGSYIFDYYRLMCRYKMLEDPVYFIKAAWIRPEDLQIYENIGITSFKLVDRSMDTDALGLIVDAYSKRSYKGNLYDLFVSPSRSQWLKQTGVIHKWKYFFHPFSINIFRLIKDRHIVKDIEVFIDNTKLEGFINFFLKNNCRSMSCDECGYCREISQKTIKLDPEYRDKIAAEYKHILDEISSGVLLKY